MRVPRGFISKKAMARVLRQTRKYRSIETPPDDPQSRQREAEFQVAQIGEFDIRAGRAELSEYYARAKQR